MGTPFHRPSTQLILGGVGALITSRCAIEGTELGVIYLVPETLTELIAGLNKKKEFCFVKKLLGWQLKAHTAPHLFRTVFRSPCADPQ